MTIREAIDRCNTLKPNQYPDDMKMTWLSELDTRIYNDIFLTHEDNPYVVVAEVTKENEIHFPYEDDEQMLLAEEPYDVLYVSYLKAKIDEYNEETTRYANSSAEYNSQYQDYARFYNRAHMPITKRFGHRPIPPIPPMPRDIDEHPSPSSKNPVMSCGIWAALQPKADKTEIPTTLAELESDINHNTVSAAQEQYWDGKQDALTFDTAPTAGSEHPVTSGGIKNALDTKANVSEVPQALGDLNNVAFDNLQNGDVLKYQGGGWTNGEGGSYTLPIASSDTLGGIKVGSNLTIEEDGTLNATGGGGTSDYDDLTDKPQINGVILSGNKTLANLGIEPASVSVTGTLTAGQTGITLSNAAITTDSTIDIYTDAYGVNPTGVTVANGSITLTFTAQLTNLGVKAVIR